jgi:hypothetical protein
VSPIHPTAADPVSPTRLTAAADSASPTHPKGAAGSVSRTRLTAAADPASPIHPKGVADPANPTRLRAAAGPNPIHPMAAADRHRLPNPILHRRNLRARRPLTRPRRIERSLSASRCSPPSRECDGASNSARIEGSAPTRRAPSPHPVGALVSMHAPAVVTNDRALVLRDSRPLALVVRQSSTDRRAARLTWTQRK